jgi:hypothetical protein
MDHTLTMNVMTRDRAVGGIVEQHPSVLDVKQ